MGEVIAAVVATALSITVLPFATAVASNWLDDRRALARRRREVYEELSVLSAKDTSNETVERENELRFTLYALMGPRDDDVRKATGKALTYAATPEENAVMRWWVFGHRRAARKLAKRLIATTTSQ